MTSDPLVLFLITLGAYLMGSVSFAVLVSQVMKLPDPRSFGSKNPGATNMLRGGSRLGAAIVLLGDAVKGWLAVWLAIHVLVPLGIAEGAVALVAIAVFLGHGYPVFFRFKGGKGVATALGILLALNPLMGLCSLVVWLSVMAVTRISSLSALCTSLATPFFGLFFLQTWLLRGTVFLLAVILLLHHHANIRKLLAGQETIFRQRE
ncbi:glycerol-3-phosphate 1-O-acyltransferase PlsY [Ferrovum myxofaciens]|jgi:glycerol-3-phosphate acyltransferase PlsY|uniref:Glycerol-3-phosphate acyltransferase n=1 Tax=Ferrovum myxofaciens TaxID=416213 RepID=A0A8F3IH44_9PROT|nr:glycerol-3-phosphate 1-O-acyltransferase PlsY [Ferrovum myxofaciens]MBW8028426.1 glycerol-3-phosphate 1-O-acyltransferase PlsY [Ferrovum sp.]KXW58895.1 putative glycerol-3-phosphate acyltransferase [Ferrovum myxofaciens]MBU6995262.1 glycerol-3-phosphate 1-O-acyltransferase PlsY [Ferrovum myxofaciens]NDU90333.1 glycerol-3-phosphate 1-O-acyltransferase PlsY [Ferrovum sp.]QKE39108.1 MAG: glycerol-3-phosphate 1-O-acyltransferase PlsY [Ferrovum myxofaciens]